MSKGSNRRPTNETVYRANYERMKANDAVHDILVGGPGTTVEFQYSDSIVGFIKDALKKQGGLSVSINKDHRGSRCVMAKVEVSSMVGDKPSMIIWDDIEPTDRLELKLTPEGEQALKDMEDKQ